ncbi:MAG: class I SAM-dependent methyltransferase [Saprospirales bacterium]|nr:class I SAM-dependent methyltransferase [Saprospirales bacterium]
MSGLLKYLKRIWLLNFFRRLYLASRTYNYRYVQILRWGLRSREDTNFTYHLTPLNISYLASLLAVALKTDFAVIAAYVDEALNDRDLQEHILRETQKSPLGRFADREVRLGRRLGWYVCVRVLKPRLVVETGVDKGLGSVLLCSALLKNRAEGFSGHYIGTDINPAAGYLLSGPYGEVGEVRYGDSIESLKKLDGPVDLFINDSDHSSGYEYQEYQVIRSKLSEKSVLLGDNSDVSEALFRFSREEQRQFLYFQEKPAGHWYPGAGIGISFVER